SSARGYSTEEKPNIPEVEKPASIEECHKQIESLTGELNTLKNQLKDYEDKYKRALADGENVRRRMMKQVADTLGAAAESVPDSAASEAGAALRALNDGVKLTRAQLT
ncbi:Uncharacterized protein OBRU01_24901, partial [Operophtera brumata]